MCIWYSQVLYIIYGIYTHNKIKGRRPLYRSLAMVVVAVNLTLYLYNYVRETQVCKWIFNSHQGTSLFKAILMFPLVRYGLSVQPLSWVAFILNRYNLSIQINRILPMFYISLQEKVKHGNFAIRLLPSDLTESCNKMMGPHLYADKVCLPFLFEFCLVCVAEISSFLTEHGPAVSGNCSTRWVK